MKTLLPFLLLSSSLFADPIPDIKRKLPPIGLKASKEETTPIWKRLKALEAKSKELQKHPLFPDVNIHFKAIRLLLENGEFYKKKRFKEIHEILDAGEKRLQELLKNQSSWTRQKGLLVRGFKSEVDHTHQPYGLEIPIDLDLEQPTPLIVWLHGRGDTKTDFYFMLDRMNKQGKFKFNKAITLHPFGRQCIGYKHVGEVDVFEAIQHVKSHYNIDPNRIALMGFSMGGAGTYHLGAHFSDQFAVVHTGAGFVETAKYNKLIPETYPPQIEQTLWKMYDVPNYTRNFFNTPIMAYCGDQDSKIPWVQLMQDSFKSQGQHLPTSVGKDIGHKYDDISIEKITEFVEQHLSQGINHHPQEIRLQTPTLKYYQNHWVQAHGLKEHWSESRIDAKRLSPTNVICKTQGITHFSLTSPWSERTHFQKGDQIQIDHQTFRINQQKTELHFHLENQQWVHGLPQNKLRKSPQLQGPMDDAYMSKFIVVTPTHKTGIKKIDQWFDFEIERLRKRWKALYRGQLPECPADKITKTHIENYNLILWGTPETNPLIQQTLSKTPLQWNPKNIQMGSISYSSSHNIPAMVYPNPLNDNQTYILYNSAPTFREGHDRTNSLQNPKLGDWAIIDLNQHPDAFFPGKIQATDFFDEAWQVK